MHQLLTSPTAPLPQPLSFGLYGTHAVASIDRRRRYERARQRRMASEDPKPIGTTSPTRRGTYQAGLFGEEVVADQLVEAGWRLLGHRVRTRVGEVDLVARRGDCIVFAEVKSAGPGRLAVEQSVSMRQRHRIRRAAVAWIAANPRLQHGVSRYRFDVFLVRRGSQDEIERIDHVEDAF